MTKDEALKLALVALENLEHSNFKRRRLDALIAIKQVLAQPEQEPVAWMYQCTADTSGPVLLRHKTNWAESGSGLWKETPLYTAPPQPVQRQPLTLNEMSAIEEYVYMQTTHKGKPLFEYAQALIRATEAAHNIGAKP